MPLFFCRRAGRQMQEGSDHLFRHSIPNLFGATFSSEHWFEWTAVMLSQKRRFGRWEGSR